MDFKIVEHSSLPDKTINLIVKMNTKDQLLFCCILEAWEGVFNYTTIDKANALMNIKIAKDFEQEAEELLSFLQTY